MDKIETIWKIKNNNIELIRELAYELDIPQSLAQVMISRNLNSPAKINKFMDLNIKKLHNPMLLPDAFPAIERISKAIDLKEKIFVWGDYDVDGITSTAIVVTALKKMGAFLEYKVPHRIEDGYDIKVQSVDEAIYRKAQLLISVDCGILAFETAKYAERIGLDLIITDHHHPSDDGSIPNCIAVVNPNRDDPKYPGEHFKKNDSFKRYPFDSLAGCGIAFKLMLGLAKFRNLDIMEYVDELIEFAALGTVADVAPMLDENRIIVNYGCQKLSTSTKSGIKELLRIANVKDVNPTSIGFQIGPRINAIGRLADAGTALDLMLAENDVIAHFLASQLDNANRKRQEQQEKATNFAIEYVKNNFDLEKEHILLVGSDNWHPGLIGLIAGKLVETFNKPSLVCSFKEDGYAKGSCRSIPSFNILEALKSENVWKLFKKKSDGSSVCGGHAFAAGFELAISNIDEMRKQLNQYASNILGEPSNIKTVEIDAKMPAYELNYKNYLLLTKLSPFGALNTNPLFVTKNLTILEKKLLTGGKHLKLQLKYGDNSKIEALWWRKGQYADILNIGDKIDLVYTLDTSSYSGKNSLVMIVEDLKKSN